MKPAILAALALSACAPHSGPTSDASTDAGLPRVLRDVKCAPSRIGRADCVVCAYTEGLHTSPALSCSWSGK